ncbi:MAG: hypothetical protein AB7G06_08905, partial [Bdellovibrionales bacterium]
MSLISWMFSENVERLEKKFSRWEKAKGLSLATYRLLDGFVLGRHTAAHTSAVLRKRYASPVAGREKASEIYYALSNPLDGHISAAATKPQKSDLQAVLCSLELPLIVKLETRQNYNMLMMEDKKTGEPRFFAGCMDYYSVTHAIERWVNHSQKQNR